MSAPYPTRASYRPAWDTGSTSPRPSPGRCQVGDSPVVDLEDVGLRNLVVENGLLDLFLLGHLPVDFLPPPGLQRDSKPPAVLLECDGGLRGGFELDVPLAHRAAARELDSVEDTSHRRFGAGLPQGPKILFLAQTPPSQPPPSEAPQHPNNAGAPGGPAGR